MLDSELSVKCIGFTTMRRFYNLFIFFTSVTSTFCTSKIALIFHFDTLKVTSPRGNKSDLVIGTAGFKSKEHTVTIRKSA